MEKALTIYKTTRDKLNAFNYAMYVISWDSETEAPVGCMEERSKQIGNLVAMMLEVSHSKEYVEAVKTLYDNKDIRERIETLRYQQSQVPTPSQVKREMNDNNKDAIIASLKRKIKRLEEENKQLKEQLKVNYAEIYKQL